MKPINNKLEAPFNFALRRRSSNNQKSVSFGSVRIHKITQGIDPPSSHLPLTFSDCDLSEARLFSLETYEQRDKSPVKRHARIRRRDDKPADIISVFHVDNSDYESAQMNLNRKLAVCNHDAGYRVIKGVTDKCAGNVLMAHDVSPRRKPKLGKKFGRLLKERETSSSRRDP